MHEDFFKMLHKDHEEIMRVLTRMEKATGKAREQELDRLMQTLIPHMKGEEVAFYPCLLAYPEAYAAAQELIDQHKKAQDILGTLVEMAGTSRDWMDTFNELKGKAQNHIDEEEGAMYDYSSDLLSHKQIEAIMTLYEEQKAKTKGKVKDK